MAVPQASERPCWYASPRPSPRSRRICSCPTTGKPTDSFVTLDLMRLPLGILTGMGFIGAGAILKKGDIVLGVTTATTLWFVTVLGLCFGGGQWILGEPRSQSVSSCSRG